MNPFVFSCITPHGGEIIPELAGREPMRMSQSRDSLRTLGDGMDSANPETIIYLTPHGVRARNAFSIADSERMRGSVEEQGTTFSVDVVVDRELAAAIADEARETGLPVAHLNYATSAGPASCLPLDWGVIVPLRFMPEVPVVVITTCYELPFEQHRAMGAAISRAVVASGRRVGLVASCDWAHTHDASGPYGFSPLAARLDARVVELVKTNRLEELAEFDPEFVDAAKPDGIWQVMVLAGAVAAPDRQVEFLSYEAPTYFGLLCARV